MMLAIRMPDQDARVYRSEKCNTEDYGNKKQRMAAPRVSNDILG